MQGNDLVVSDTAIILAYEMTKERSNYKLWFAKSFSTFISMFSKLWSSLQLNLKQNTTVEKLTNPIILTTDITLFWSYSYSGIFKISTDWIQEYLS